jgi:hypothetical protein
MLRATFCLFVRYTILAAVYYMILDVYCSRTWNCRFITKYMVISRATVERLRLCGKFACDMPYTACTSECEGLFVRNGELSAVSLLPLGTVVRVPYFIGGTRARQFLAAMPHIIMKSK